MRKTNAGPKKSKWPTLCFWLSLSLVGLLVGTAHSLARATDPGQVSDKGQHPAKGFSGTNAFKHVEKLVSFGPRPPGSSGIRAAQAYILQSLKSYGITTEQDDFTASTPLGKIDMKNIIGKIPGRKSDVVLIGGHYDTKFFKGFKFVGANDGGSSAGAVLELGRALSRRKNDLTYWLVFFDGEEALVEWSESDSLYGSRHLAQKLRETDKIKQVKAMILLDMIGDKDLKIDKDSNSSAWLKEIVWKSAAELGYGKHFSSRERADIDDHIPFVEAGVPAIDLIDFDYGFSNIYWHTAQDTLDKISPQSFQVVGDVVLKSLEKIEAKFK